MVVVISFQIALPDLHEYRFVLYWKPVIKVTDDPSQLYATAELFGKSERTCSKQMKIYFKRLIQLFPCSIKQNTCSLYLCENLLLHLFY